MTIKEFFDENRTCALAFSGGVDSAYLLYAGIQYGADVHAYYVKSEFQPQFELDDAKRLAGELHANMTIIEMSVLPYENVTENGPRRCYFCKQQIFSRIIAAAQADGYTLLLDGTNASDDADDRPGMQALRELSVRSPLRECGLTKAEIRRLSKEAGLFTWDKPAYACLATRIPTGTEITKEDLIATESAESALFALGFTDFRVRKAGDAAKLQVPAGQLPMILEKRTEILEKLKPYYQSITLDLEVRS
ncbi:MAG: ATP-dependent sacrificial sulfur transferase LarE [Lachnospiraceae bacterium]|nr:ATP-dependent sacrificial sulfur transferase LarE [Lachnospiraceae bacterium]